jgi:selenocysteine lyase/cysteine desulfurase
VGRVDHTGPRGVRAARRRTPRRRHYGPPLRLASSARRFDISPAWFSYVGTAPALELVEEIGAELIGAHNVALANRFLAGLGRPPGDSAIVTVGVPGAEERLARAGVRAAVRAGQVRASFHVYSTQADVDLALNALTDG